MKKIPKHIGIIMDGNGRWAIQKGEERLYGHYNGKVAVEKVIKACLKKQIKYLTLYTFSIENNKRSKEEVDGLMDLLVKTMDEYTSTLHKYKIKFSFIGDIANLPTHVIEKITECAKETEKYNDLVLTLALNYSSRDEIKRAVKYLCKDVQNNKIEINDIDESLISKYLDTKDIPDPDLIIRTGGEVRLSNFLLWQASYAELYFTDVLWPDFAEEDLYNAIDDFSKRERRFGKEKSV